MNNCGDKDCQFGLKGGTFIFFRLFPGSWGTLLHKMSKLSWNNWDTITMLLCQTPNEGALSTSRFRTGRWSCIILNYPCSSQQSLSIKRPNQTECHWLCWLSVEFVLMGNGDFFNLCNYMLPYIMGKTGWNQSMFFISTWCNRLLRRLHQAVLLQVVQGVFLL